MAVPASIALSPEDPVDSGGFGCSHGSRSPPPFSGRTRHGARARDQLRASAQESLIVFDSVADDDPAVADLERAQFLAVRTRADFHHSHYARQLPLQLDVPLQDDGIH